MSTVKTRGQRKIQTPVFPATSKPLRQLPGSKVDFAAREEPEPQGQAATPGKLARRNTPCRSGRKHVQHARHRPPVLGPGRASQPATDCKQWPVSFSRLEYQAIARKKLNRFWLLSANFWRLISAARTEPGAVKIRVAARTRAGIIPAGACPRRRYQRGDFDQRRADHRAAEMAE